VGSSVHLAPFVIQPIIYHVVKKVYDTVRHTYTILPFSDHHSQLHNSPPHFKVIYHVYQFSRHLSRVLDIINHAVREIIYHTPNHYDLREAEHMRQPPNSSRSFYTCDCSFCTCRLPRILLPFNLTRSDSRAS